MSDLDTRPREQRVGAREAPGPEQLITARRVPLGRTTEVARALPDREVRMIGAWCFLDHYGPEDLGDGPGMQVWAHPHTGLQTVSWLLEGEVEHRDSLGSVALVRPGTLNLMTAGHGIVHSELSPGSRPPRLHGVQLWVALPDGVRDMAPEFVAHADLPDVVGAEADGVRGTVLLGTVNGVRSPATPHTPLGGADLTLEPGATAVLALEPGWEHGVFVVEGAVATDGTPVATDQLLYLAPGRSTLAVSSARGGRVLLLGGEPFPEEIVMWWNFVGRSHDEVVGYREAWVSRQPRFPPVVDRTERVMEAPPLPTVRLRSRPRRADRP